MIPVEHLRIRNIVSVADEQCTVFNIGNIYLRLAHGIYNYGFPDDFSCDDDEGTTKHWHDVNPITLTDEWLLKFGFKKYNECFYSIGKIDGWYLNKDGEVTKCLSETNVRVESVHKLQNLYFALTGTELQICES